MFISILVNYITGEEGLCNFSQMTSKITYQAQFQFPPPPPPPMFPEDFSIKLQACPYLFSFQADLALLSHSLQYLFNIMYVKDLVSLTYYQYWLILYKFICTTVHCTVLIFLMLLSMKIKTKYFSQKTANSIKLKLPVEQMTKTKTK